MQYNNIVYFEKRQSSCLYYYILLFRLPITDRYSEPSMYNIIPLYLRQSLAI